MKIQIDISDIVSGLPEKQDFFWYDKLRVQNSKAKKLVEDFDLASRISENTTFIFKIVTHQICEYPKDVTRPLIDACLKAGIPVKMVQENIKFDNEKNHGFNTIYEWGAYVENRAAKLNPDNISWKSCPKFFLPNVGARFRVSSLPGLTFLGRGLDNFNLLKSILKTEDFYKRRDHIRELKRENKDYVKVTIPEGVILTLSSYNIGNNIKYPYLKFKLENNKTIHVDGHEVLTGPTSYVSIKADELGSTCSLMWDGK